MRCPVGRHAEERSGLEIRIWGWCALNRMRSLRKCGKGFRGSREDTAGRWECQEERNEAWLEDPSKPQVGQISGSSCPAIHFLSLGLAFSPDKAPPRAPQAAQYRGSIKPRLPEGCLAGSPGS